MTTDERRVIQQQIERAREGVGDRIDELDHHLRATLDFTTMVREHATKIVAGGAVVGFLVGFGFPRKLGRLIAAGVPVAMFAWKVKQSREGHD